MPLIKIPLYLLKVILLRFHENIYLKCLKCVCTFFFCWTNWADWGAGGGAPQATAKRLTIEAKSHKRSHLFNFWDFVYPFHLCMHLHPTIFPSSFTPPTPHPRVQHPLILPCPPYSLPPPFCLSPSSLYQRRFSPFRPSLLGNPSAA